MSAEFLRRLLALAFAAALCGCASDRVRIVSYNIRHGEGADGKVDLDRAAAVIRAERPDFVALQEVDCARPRSGSQDQAAVLGRLTGMHPVFAPAFRTADGGLYGVALLAREVPLSVGMAPLPNWPGVEPRILLSAEFANCRLAVTHLQNAATNTPLRLAAVDTIRADAEKGDKPYFVCGDWNDGPDSPVLAKIGESFKLLSATDAPTFFGFRPTSRPRCIDYVAVDRAHAGGISPIASRVVRAKGVSDHAMLVVDVENCPKP